MPKEKDVNECQELKNIQYKSMLLNPHSNTTMDTLVGANTDLSNMDAMLEAEKNANKNATWNKLDKCIKINKLYEYVDKYIESNKLNEEDSVQLKEYLRERLDRKKLRGTKDIEYNKDTGIITNILTLVHDKKSNKFTLKDNDKKVGGSSSYKLSLAPPKRKTKKEKDSNKEKKKKSIKNLSRGSKSPPSSPKNNKN